MIAVIAFIAGICLIAFVLSDAFQTMVLPRSANSTLRLTGVFYRVVWRNWRRVALMMRAGNRREAHLWAFGPLSLILLMMLWATLLLFGFALLQYGVGSHLSNAKPTFWSDLYVSGSTLFTLGYGDVAPLTGLGRLVSVVEAGTGLGFLAMVIGYFPVLYQAFGRREVTISMLDSRAGSPPSAAEILKRHAEGDGPADMTVLLAEWERWAAELLESHLSFPVLSFYRSQHDRQSWLASLTAIMDTSALIIAGMDVPSRRQARLTFAMGRHALIDLSLIFNQRPASPDPDRLPPEACALLQQRLKDAHIPVKPNTAEELSRLRRMYEPYVEALSQFLMVDLPPWHPEGDVIDNWEASAWEKHDPHAGDFILHPSVARKRREP